MNTKSCTGFGKLRDPFRTELTSPRLYPEFHGKFDKVKADIPDDIPDPSDTDIATGDRCNVSERPVCEAGNERGDCRGGKTQK